MKILEETEIGLVIPRSTVPLDIISMCEQRKDCVSFISPEQTDVVNNSGNDPIVVEFRNTLGSTSIVLWIVVTSISMTDTTMSSDMYL